MRTLLGTIVFVPASGTLAVYRGGKAVSAHTEMEVQRAIGPFQKRDIGKRAYRVHGNIVQVENDAQREERLRHVGNYPAYLRQLAINLAKAHAISLDDFDTLIAMAEDLAQRNT